MVISEAIYPEPLIDIKPTCFGENDGRIEVMLTNGGTAPYQYKLSGTITEQQPDGIFDNLPPGTYLLTVGDANECAWDTSIVIGEIPEIQLELDPEVTMHLGEEIQLHATVTNSPPVIISSMTWTPGDSLNCIHCYDPITSTTSSIIYTFTVTDVNGCEARESIRVIVDKRPHIFIPNVFSPNDDGQDDILPVFGDQSVLIIREFEIFDRWGERVYRAVNFSPNNPYFGWDGNFNGEPMNPAVFVYYALVELIDGQVVLVKGDITLTR